MDDQAAQNKRRSLVLTAAFVLLVGTVLAVILVLLGLGLVGVLIAAAVAGGSAFAAWSRSDAVALRLSGAVEADPVTYARLHNLVEGLCVASGLPTVANGRFKGGYITRHYGRPDNGVHAIQMELAMRAYLTEPAVPDETNWPVPLDEAIAAPARATLKRVLGACLTFAREAT